MFLAIGAFSRNGAGLSHPTYPRAASCSLASLVSEAGRGLSVRGRHHLVVTDGVENLLIDLDAAAQIHRLRRVRPRIVDLEHPRLDDLDRTPHRHHLRLPTVLEEGLHGLPHHDLLIGRQEIEVRVEARPRGNGVEDPARADRGLHPAGRDAAARRDQRNPHDALIEEVAVQKLAVVAETFAVIAHDESPRTGAGIPVFECIDQPPDLLVHIGNFAEVRV